MTKFPPMPKMSEIAISTGCPPAKNLSNLFPSCPCPHLILNHTLGKKISAIAFRQILGTHFKEHNYESFELNPLIYHKSIQQDQKSVAELVWSCLKQILMHTITSTLFLTLLLNHHIKKASTTVET